MNQSKIAEVEIPKGSSRTGLNNSIIKERLVFTGIGRKMLEESQPRIRKKSVNI